MEELKKLFEDYMTEFKKLDTKQKRNEIIESIQSFMAVFDQLAKLDNIKLEYLSNREIMDLDKEFVSEDDFLEAELVYLEAAKNIVGQYLEAKENKED